MTATELQTALEARIAQLPEHEHWRWNVETDLDDDGDGKVMLSVSYDEDCMPEGEEYSDEPWEAFGDLPVETAESGMENDQNGTVYQFLTWEIAEGVVA